MTSRATGCRKFVVIVSVDRTFTFGARSVVPRNEAAGRKRCCSGGQHSNTLVASGDRQSMWAMGCRSTPNVQVRLLGLVADLVECVRVACTLPRKRSIKHLTVRAQKASKNANEYPKPAQQGRDDKTNTRNDGQSRHMSRATDQHCSKRVAYQEVQESDELFSRF